MARQRRDVRTIDAATTLQPSDDDVTLIVGAANLVVTLPPASALTKGMRVTAIVLTLSSSGTGFSFSPNASDKIQGKTVAGVALGSGDDKDLQNTTATDVAGDYCTLVCDGVDGWLVVALGGVWVSES